MKPGNRELRPESTTRFLGVRSLANLIKRVQDGPSRTVLMVGHEEDGKGKEIGERWFLFTR